MLIWIPECRLEWSQGYTESHSSVINTVWPHSQSLDQEQSSCGLGHSSWVYSISELVLGLMFTDIYLSYCLWLLNFNFQYFALGKYGFVVDDEVLKWNGIFSVVLGDMYLFSLILILSPLIYFIWFLFNQHPLIILIRCSPPSPIVLWLCFIVSSSVFSMCVLLAFYFGVGFLVGFYLRFFYFSFSPLFFS